MMLAPLQVSSAPYAGCPEDIAVPSDPSIQEQIEKVVGGLEILIELGSRLNGTILNIPDLQNVRMAHHCCWAAWHDHTFSSVAN